MLSFCSLDLIPDWGTEILGAAELGQKRKRIDLSKHTQWLCEVMVVLISLIVVTL